MEVVRCKDDSLFFQFIVNTRFDVKDSLVDGIKKLDGVKSTCNGRYSVQISIAPLFDLDEFTVRLNKFLTVYLESRNTLNNSLKKDKEVPNFVPPSPYLDIAWDGEEPREYSSYGPVELNKALNLSIKNEDYEKAALIRDEINLRKKKT